MKITNLKVTDIKCWKHGKRVGEVEFEFIEIGLAMPATIFEKDDGRYSISIPFLENGYVKLNRLGFEDLNIQEAKLAVANLKSALLDVFMFHIGEYKPAEVTDADKQFGGCNRCQFCTKERTPKRDRLKNDKVQPGMTQNRYKCILKDEYLDDHFIDWKEREDERGRIRGNSIVRHDNKELGHTETIPAAIRHKEVVADNICRYYKDHNATMALTGKSYWEGLTTIKTKYFSINTEFVRKFPSLDPEVEMGIIDLANVKPDYEDVGDNLNLEIDDTNKISPVTDQGLNYTKFLIKYSVEKDPAEYESSITDSDYYRFDQNQYKNKKVAKTKIWQQVKEVIDLKFQENPKITKADIWMYPQGYDREGINNSAEYQSFYSRKHHVETVENYNDNAGTVEHDVMELSNNRNCSYHAAEGTVSNGAETNPEKTQSSGMLQRASMAYSGSVEDQVLTKIAVEDEVGKEFESREEMVDSLAKDVEKEAGIDDDPNKLKKELIKMKEIIDNVDGIGKEIGRRIGKVLGTAITNIEEVSIEDLKEIKGIGAAKAEKVLAFIQDYAASAKNNQESTESSSKDSTNNDSKEDEKCQEEPTKEDSAHIYTAIGKTPLSSFSEETTTNEEDDKMNKVKELERKVNELESKLSKKDEEIRSYKREIKERDKLLQDFESRLDEKEEYSGVNDKEVDAEIIHEETSRLLEIANITENKELHDTALRLMNAVKDEDYEPIDTTEEKGRDNNLPAAEGPADFEADFKRKVGKKTYSRIEVETCKQDNIDFVGKLHREDTYIKFAYNKDKDKVVLATKGSKRFKDPKSIIWKQDWRKVIIAIIKKGIKRCKNQVTA